MMMIKGDSKTFTLEGRCPFCGEIFHITVPTEGYVLWKYEGVLIQEALPMLTANEREQLISGICPKCWDGLFGGEDC